MYCEIKEQVARLEPDALVKLLLKRAASDEDFQLWLAVELEAVNARARQSSPDPALFRRRAEALLSAGNAGWDRRHWDDQESAIDEAAFEELIGQAEPFLAAGDGMSALAILRPIAEALAEYGCELVEQGDYGLYEILPMLNRLIAQAVLLDGISLDARNDLLDGLNAWRDRLRRYGSDDVFDLAILTATRGWDEHGLLDVLDGRSGHWPLTETCAWPEDRLTSVYLGALEAMGRWDHFLNLSKATGRHGDHAVMLARMDCFEEAVNYAHANFGDPDDALCLARALLDKGQRDLALDAADWGLSLPVEGNEAWSSARHGRGMLARWLRTEAQTGNRNDLALSAAIAAFEVSLSSEDFESARHVSGTAHWPQTRALLLRHLMEAGHAYDRVAILLGENLLDDALEIVDRENDRFYSARDETLMRLTDEACSHRPEWAMRFAWDMARPIMEQGRSSRYDVAAQWLEKLGRAYREAGRQDAWRVRLDGLIDTHRRKHKLRGYLEALRKQG